MAKSYVRFNNVTIDPDSVITRAYVVFTSHDALDDVDANVKCYFTDEDNPTAPVSKGDLDGRSLTSEIDWTNLNQWVDNRIYTSPDLSSILQTVMDRDGWINGNSVLFVMNDDSSPSNRHRMFSAIEFVSGAEKAELRISWEPARQIERIDFTPEQGAYGSDVGVTIEAYPTGCNIYYTLDGSDPDQNSTLYTVPLPLTTSKYNYHIRARAYKQYWLPSEIYDAYYFTTNFWRSELIFDSGPERIRDVRIAIDSNDVPHIVFSKKNTSIGVDGTWFIYYTNKISGSWGPLEVVHQLEYATETMGAMPWTVEFVLDSNDTPIVMWSEERTWMSRLSNKFCKAVKTNGSWSLDHPISDFTPYIIVWFRLKIGSDDTLHIIYSDYTVAQAELKYAYQTGGTGSWNINNFESTEYIYDFVLDSDDYVHTVLLDSASLPNKMWYKHNMTGSWTEEEWEPMPENSDIKYFVSVRIGLGYNKEPEILAVGNLYHINAACAGIGRYNSVMDRWYRDHSPDRTWTIKRMEDAGGYISYVGYCIYDKYFTLDSMVMMQVTPTIYIPIYFILQFSSATRYNFYLYRGWNADIFIDGTRRTFIDAHQAIASNNEIHGIYTLIYDCTTPGGGNCYELYYGRTTGTEFREYL